MQVSPCVTRVFVTCRYTYEKEVYLYLRVVVIVGARSMMSNDNAASTFVCRTCPLTFQRPAALALHEKSCNSEEAKARHLKQVQQEAYLLEESGHCRLPSPCPPLLSPCVCDVRHSRFSIVCDPCIYIPGRSTCSIVCCVCICIPGCSRYSTVCDVCIYIRALEMLYCL